MFLVALAFDFSTVGNFLNGATIPMAHHDGGALSRSKGVQCLGHPGGQLNAACQALW